MLSGIDNRFKRLFFIVCLEGKESLDALAIGSGQLLLRGE